MHNNSTKARVLNDFRAAEKKYVMIVSLMEKKKKKTGEISRKYHLVVERKEGVEKNIPFIAGN